MTNELKPYSADLPEPSFETSEQFQRILESLRREGSVNFRYIATELMGKALSDKVKEELTSLIIGKIEYCFRHGNFSDLVGARDVLNILGIDKLEFSSEYIDLVKRLYGQFSLGFLMKMAPSLYNGRLEHFDGPLYDRNEYTKQLLREKGFSESELTDDFINKLWQVREVLVLLHEQRSQRPSAQEKDQITAIEILALENQKE
jgi:hypothetical protein